MKNFENLTKSEIKKAEAAANKFFNRKDSKITGWFAKKGDVEGFYDVVCEVCFNYEERADNDVVISVFMPDRRRSFAVVKTW